MSIHNLNKLIGNSKIQALKSYLNTDKITVLYSEWSNVIGIRTYKKDVNKSKHKLAVKYITEQLQNTPINILTSYPKVNITKCK